ncbi:LysR family transcriptional regulator [Vibrio mangrovi]|uniref:HTH-type transcriptional regulator DmlR n=1 Tax=Vibrio mangrovi TaxID=474394 RepID=A0A1Y6IWU7_9VIBR|nr:LysR family transcriptional regulator [Vibrio mangrovi]MDW6005443.1 LysR family transcriptional regulator [Vibrio mangrovi]SMS02116.1 HTH-type transcriptional regulator DmlR [Vibrio mangrovi]
MDKIEAMKRFISVAQTGSFTRASEQLNVPKSAISTSISKLEEHLQTRLLYRSTRQVSLSEAGERYYIQCLRLLDELEGLENQFQRESQELHGVIKVDMPGRFFSAIVAPHLPEWFQQYPKTQIKLLGADYRIDPIKERVDCVIRGGELENSNLVRRSLGAVDMVNCISPGYAEHYGIPVSLDDLKNHYVVDYSPAHTQLQNGFEYHRNNQTCFVPVPSLISVATTDAYLSACLNGLGIIQLPKTGVKQQLARGELIEVLTEFTCAPMSLSVLYESRSQQPRRLSEFINWLVVLFKQINNNAK